MKKFNLVLLQDVKKGDNVKTRRLEAPLKTKCETKEQLLSKAVEITRLLAITRNEQLISGSKFVTPFNLGSTFKVGIEVDGVTNIYEGAKNGIQFGTNKQQVKLSYAVKEQMSKGQIVATSCEVFTKRSCLIAKQIYLTLCQSFDIAHELTQETKDDMYSAITTQTRKLLS